VFRPRLSLPRARMRDEGTHAARSVGQKHLDASEDHVHFCLVLLVPLWHAQGVRSTLARTHARTLDPLLTGQFGQQGF